jgi:hypothetical protein
MTMATYAYDQIDHARAELNRGLEIDSIETGLVVAVGRITPSEHTHSLVSFVQPRSSTIDLIFARQYANCIDSSSAFRSVSG